MIGSCFGAMNRRLLGLGLLIVSIERNHRDRLGKEARKKLDEERELRAKVSAQQPLF